VLSPRAPALLFVALLSAYSVQWMYVIRHLPPVTLGMEAHLRPGAHALVVEGVSPQGPAEQAGLRPGDLITAIEGQRLDSSEPYLALRRDARPGTPVHLAVMHEGTLHDYLLTPEVRPDAPPGVTTWTRLHVARFFEQILGLYPLPFLLVAAVVLLQRPEDPHAWLLAIMLGGFITLAPIAEFEFRLLTFLRGPTLAFWVLLSVPTAAVTYAFFSVFPAHSPLDRRVPWLKWVGGIVAGLVAMVVAVSCLIGGGSYALNWIEEQTAGRVITLDSAIGTYTIVFFLLSTVSLALNAFGAPDVRRKTRVILFGMLVGLLPVMTLQILAGLFGVPPQSLPFIFWVGSIMALFAIPISLGYAVVKHRAMEIPALLRRSARYLMVRRGLVTLAIAVGVAVTLGFARIVNTFSAMPGDQLSLGLVAGSIFGGALALVGQRAWQPAAERLDRAFFRSSFDARRLLEVLADQSRLATDRAGLAELIDRSVAEALHPQSLLVFLRGSDDGTFEAAAHEGLSGAAARMPATAMQLQELMRRGRPLLIDPLQLEPGGWWRTFAPLAPEALVPMVGRSGKMEGVLVLGRRLSDEPYSGEDRNLLASVGTQAGLALENIRLAESMASRLDAERRASRELEIARDVQAKLLPQGRVTVPTLDSAGQCFQARVVGGDFFDFMSVGSTRVALVLADISGKGISAALLMASLQANLRALYGQAVDDLAGTLQRVNQMFYDSTAPNHYATLFFGLYDTETRRLTYANCGHLPPLVQRADGSIDRLDVTAPVIGLFTPWACETSVASLAPGDTLVVFTDGVSEATSEAGEEFGEERLASVVRAHRHDSAPALLDAIVAEVRGHSSREQFDDLTLIVAKVS
jgi:phosphoserine phosphatase RsbU/P